MQIPIFLGVNKHHPPQTQELGSRRDVDVIFLFRHGNCTLQPPRTSHPPQGRGRVLFEPVPYTDHHSPSPCTVAGPGRLRDARWRTGGGTGPPVTGKFGPGALPVYRVCVWGTLRTLGFTSVGSTGRLGLLFYYRAMTVRDVKPHQKLHRNKTFPGYLCKYQFFLGILVSDQSLSFL